MIISNHKTIYTNVAEKNGWDPELVEMIGQFAWGDLNERISTFAHREIYMLKIGTFKFRKIKGENYLKNLKKAASMAVNNPLFSDEAREKHVSNMYKRISAIEERLKEWDHIIKEREEFKNEQAKRNIQKQDVDLGGVEEQAI